MFLQQSKILYNMDVMTTPIKSWDEIYDYLQETMKVPIKKKRIRAITVNPSNHWQPKMRIEVGKYYANLEYHTPPELVVAIFEATVFYVCTPARGAGQGLPYFFSREDVRQVEPWDD